MSGPKSPEEVLEWIQSVAANEGIEMAADSLTSPLDPEIQEIYATINQVLYGQPPRRPLWVANGQQLNAVLPLTDEGRTTPQGIAAVRVAGERLGITLSYTDLWEDAAMRLLSYRKVALSD